VPAGDKTRQREDCNSNKAIAGEKKPKDEKSPTSKKAKPAESPHDGAKEEAAISVDKAKLNTIMEAYGILPLVDSG